MRLSHFAPLPPTTATLLVQASHPDSRTTLTVIASDKMVYGTVRIMCEFLGFESSLPHMIQTAGVAPLSQLAIACDLWISGSRLQSKIVDSARMSLGALVIGCLTPLAVEQDLNEGTAATQIRAASFGLFSSLAYSLVARQDPEQFDSVASVAQMRQIPIAGAYQSVVGESIRDAAGRLAHAWGLTRELSIALQGPRDFYLDPTERLIVDACEVATMAAQAAGVSVEPWPYIAKQDSIEQIALIQAMAMRAKRVAGRLEEELENLRSSA
jgi:hypothetical protein